MDKLTVTYVLGAVRESKTVERGLDEAIVSVYREAGDWDVIELSLGGIVMATVKPGGRIWRRTGR